MVGGMVAQMLLCPNSLCCCHTLTLSFKHSQSLLLFCLLHSNTPPQALPLSSPRGFSHSFQHHRATLGLFLVAGVMTLSLVTSAREEEGEVELEGKGDEREDGWKE